MSIRSLIILFAVSCVVTTSIGCAGYISRFSPPIKQDVNVILKEDDFAIAETNLVGEASVTYALGFIPLGEVRLYSSALGDLYAKATEQVTDESSQLINWTIDETNTFYVIFSRKKVRFRADLIKFKK